MVEALAVQGDLDGPQAGERVLGNECSGHRQGSTVAGVSTVMNGTVTIW